MRSMTWRATEIGLRYPLSAVTCLCKVVPSIIAALNSASPRDRFGAPPKPTERTVGSRFDDANADLYGIQRGGIVSQCVDGRGNARHAFTVYQDRYIRNSRVLGFAIARGLVRG